MKLVMIVEDDIEISKILKETLELAAYQTMTAANGKIALELLTQSKRLPDLILLDLMMPVMNGWEFATEVKKNKRLASIPILVISAFVDKADSIDCVGFIQKPINLSELLSIVKSHLDEGVRHA